MIKEGLDYRWANNIWKRSWCSRCLVQLMLCSGLPIFYFLIRPAIRLIHKRIVMVNQIYERLLFEWVNSNFKPKFWFVKDLISLELPLTNPLRIPVRLCDIRLLWNFSGADGNLSNLLTSNNNLLVTTYILPRIVLNPSSSLKVNSCLWLSSVMVILNFMVII